MMTKPGIPDEQKYIGADEMIARLTADLARVKAELAKWQRPFDQERLDAAKHQASRKDSLAAMQVYIIALEHGIKAITTERNAALKDAERYRWLRDNDADPVCLSEIWLPRGGTAEQLDAAIDAAREGK